MNRSIDKKVYEPLSNFDISDFTNDLNKRPANIQMYKDIKKMKTINTLFKNYDYCIIFLENSDKKNPVGHWVMVFKNGKDKNTVFFYDSYGESINDLCPKLIPLLSKKFKQIHINKIPYQQYGDDSATCGRHCIFNVGVNNLITNHNFDNLKHIMDYLKKKYNLKTYNQVVSKIVDISL